MPRDYEQAIDKIRFAVRTLEGAADQLKPGFERSKLMAKAANYTEVADFLNEGVGKFERAAKKGAKKR